MNISTKINFLEFFLFDVLWVYEEELFFFKIIFSKILKNPLYVYEEGIINTPPSIG